MNPKATLFAATLLASADPVSGDSPDFEFLRIPGNAADAARPAPKYRFMFGERASWPGPLQWKYNHANAPASLGADPGATQALVQTALQSWTAGCGLTFVYEGETDTPPNRRVVHPYLGEQPDHVNIVGWGTLSGSQSGITYVWHSGFGPGGTLVDSDIVLSPDRVRSANDIQRTATHEWGHAIGLSHSDEVGALMSGPPETPYNSLDSLQGDDLRGCRCLYGPAAGQSAGYACSPPTRIDFGPVPVGGASAPRTATLKNDGNGPLTLNGVLVSSVRVSKTDGCPAGHVLAPDESCSLTLVAWPDRVYRYSEVLTFATSDGPYRVSVMFDGSAERPTTPAVVQLLEYHHAVFDHYFLTHLPEEIVKLDNATFAGWSRTGRMINAWKDPGGASSPICRFFSATFAPKSSHFYTPFASECESFKRGADWSFEGEGFHVALPDLQGHCTAGMQPVFRIYNGGRSGAPNHRFTTDSLLRQQMIAQGWVPEGAGPGVAMCSPL